LWSAVGTHTFILWSAVHCHNFRDFHKIIYYFTDQSCLVLTLHCVVLLLVQACSLGVCSCSHLASSLRLTAVWMAAAAYLFASITESRPIRHSANILQMLRSPICAAAHYRFEWCN
jgi:hypothetical protein